MSGQAILRLVLLVVLGGVVVGVGFLVVRERDPLVPYRDAAQAYAELRKGGAGDYDAALLQISESQKRLGGTHPLDPDAVRKLTGDLLLLKSRLLRDRAYAKATADGNPLPETIDSVTGERYRSILAIPDVASRDEAANCLMAAALQFPTDNPDVPLDALRLALMLQPIRWDAVDKLSRMILETKPDDPRAHYLLAKFHFEQPDERGNPLTPMKRSRRRIHEAADHLVAIKADADFPRWRVEHLRSAVHFWHVKYGSSQEQNDHLAALERSLLDVDIGVLVRLRDREGFESLTSWDRDAIVGLLKMSPDVALERVRRRIVEYTDLPKRPDFAPLGHAWREMIAFCDAAATRPDSLFTPDILLDALLPAMVDGQSIVATELAADWDAALDVARRLLAADLSTDRADPTRSAQFAEILAYQASIDGRRNVAAEKLSARLDEAKTWIDRGLTIGRRRQLGGDAMAPAHLAAANVGVLRGEPRNAIAGHLAALMATGQPKARATALLLDGCLDERDGRLLRGKDKVEQAVRVVGGDEEVRGNATLANMYLELGSPDDALVNLAHLDKAYERMPELSLQEADWLERTIGVPQRLAALTVLASVDQARRRAEAFFARNPNVKSLPPDVIRVDEERARKRLTAELKSQKSTSAFLALSAWIEHLAATGRGIEADDEWRTLRGTQPDRVELLQLKIALVEEAWKEGGDLTRRQSLVDGIDQLFAEFLTAHPTSAAAQLQRAVWLARTRRGDEAAAAALGVESSSTSPRTRQVARAIRFFLPDLHVGIDSARRAPALARALYDLARTSPDSFSEVRAVFARHQTIGLDRIVAAAGLFDAGQFAAATDAFAGCLDFADVKPLAEIGFLRSAIALAESDTDAALAKVEAIQHEFSRESICWLALAEVFLRAGNVGDPTDVWLQRHTMGAALHAWDLAVAESRSPSRIALTHADYWFRAHRGDIALTQARKALRTDRNDPAVLTATIGMLLEQPSAESKAELRELLDDLRRVAPQYLSTQRLLGRAAELARQWDEAIRIYEGIAARASKDRSTYARLVELHRNHGSPAEAARWARKWRSELPNDPRAVAAAIAATLHPRPTPESLAAAKEMADALLAAVGNPPSDAARAAIDVELARGFRLGGAIDEAERRLIPHASTQLAAAEMLAGIAAEKRDWIRAEELLQSIVRQSPRNMEAVNALARLVAVEKRDPARARTIVRASLGTPPQSLLPRTTVPDDLLSTMGTIYDALADPSLAREMLQFYTAAAGRFPNDPRVDLYSGLGYELLGDISRARELYDRAIQRAGEGTLPESRRIEVLRDAARFRDRVAAKAAAK